MYLFQIGAIEHLRNVSAATIPTPHQVGLKVNESLVNIVNFLYSPSLVITVRIIALKRKQIVYHEYAFLGRRIREKSPSCSRKCHSFLETTDRGRTGLVDWLHCVLGKH